MVTKLADGRGQISIRSVKVTNEWEALVKGAAKRSGAHFPDWAVHVLADAAQRQLKGQAATPDARPPVRMEDILDVLKATQEQQAALAREQAEAAERARQEQVERLEKLERALAERQEPGGMGQDDRTAVEIVERLERKMAEQRAEEQRAARRGRWRR